MDRELTEFEKNTKLLAEKENPYATTCPNRHLWNEGYERGFTEAKNISSNLHVMLSLLAKIDEEISCYERFRARNNPKSDNDSVTKEYANRKIEITGRMQVEDNWFNNINGLRNAKRIIVETFANNGA